MTLTNDVVMDVIGQEVRVGDEILSAHANNGRVWMQRSTVFAIKKPDPTYDYGFSSSYQVKLQLQHEPTDWAPARTTHIHKAPIVKIPGGNDV